LLIENHLGFNGLGEPRLWSYSSMFSHQNGFIWSLKKFRLKLINSLLFGGVNDVPHAHSHPCECFYQTGI